MADTFKRLGNLLKGMGSEWLSRVESENPRAVVKAAMEGAEGRYREATQNLGRLKQKGAASEKEIAKLRKEQAELEAHRASVAEGDPALAARLGETLVQLETRIETLQTEDTERERLMAELELRAEELKTQAASLRSEGDSLTARSMIAEDASARESLNAGAPTRAYERALQTVRDKTEAARQQADALGPSEAELNRLKAESRLAALKAERLKAIGVAPEEAPAPEAAPGSAEGEGEGEGDAAPRLPRRDL